ncbi:hypothetical protein ES703_25839 [subsurface metagenome]
MTDYICPLMVQHGPGVSVDEANNKALCLREGCAWYNQIDNECIVWALYTRMMRSDCRDYDEQRRS